MLTRLARWWLDRKARPAAPAHPVPVGECICGKEVRGDDWHIVVALPDDDSSLGIDGATAMSADFCAEHCPGGCRRGCAKIRA